jgi:hypothetical protein
MSNGPKPFSPNTRRILREMGLVRRPFGLIDQVNSVGRKPESVAQQGMPAATCEDRNTALRMCIYFSLHHSTNSTM